MSLTATITVETLKTHGLDLQEAQWFLDRLSKAPNGSELVIWQWLIKNILSPKIPFSLHRYVHQTLFQQWDEEQQGPPPVWVPSDEEKSQTNISALMPGDDFSAVHRLSVQQPEFYWRKMLSSLRIRFEKTPQKMLSRKGKDENVTWLPGAELNIAQSCFAQRRSADVVLIWQSEEGEIQRMKRSELLHKVRQISICLNAAGFRSGDVIALGAPMTAETVCLYLGIIWAGCVVLPIEHSLRAEDVDARLNFSKAKGIFINDESWEEEPHPTLFEKLLLRNGPRAIVLKMKPSKRHLLRQEDFNWDSFIELAPVAAQAPGYEPAIHDIAQPTHIFLSKTSDGALKSVSWNQATPIKLAADGWAHHDIRIGDVISWPAYFSEMMGPWSIYASLLNGATLALFEGQPKKRSFGQFVQAARVNILGVTPSFVKAWRDSSCMSGLHWAEIKCFSSEKSVSHEEDMHWLMALADYKPVITYCGDIENGGGYAAGSMMQPQAPGTCSTKTLGVEFQIVNENGLATSQGQLLVTQPILGSSGVSQNMSHRVQALGQGYYRIDTD